ncbi:hypothetical protein Tco_1253281 [Tanacetum coccineum]
MLIYIIQQLSKGSSEGSGIIPEVPDEPKDNSGSSSSSLSGSNDEVQDVSSDEENKADENKADAESMVDVPIHQKDLVVQRTPLIDSVISMATEKTTSTLTPPTIQAQVTNVSESDSSSKERSERTNEMRKIIDNQLLEQWIMRSLEGLGPVLDFILERSERTNKMRKIIDNQLLEQRIMRSLEGLGGGRNIETDKRLLLRTV